MLRVVLMPVEQLLRIAERKTGTMQPLGRFLQLVGLASLPLAMFLELNNSLGREFHLSEMVIMLVFGIAAFVLGRLIEGYSR